MGTLAIYNVLGMASRLKIPILQASTSEIYGDPEVHPQVEEYWGNVNPIGPRACYDEGKRVAEALCMAYKEYNDVSIRIVRIFNTYGPYMDINDGRVISNLIVQAIRKEPLTVYGNGTQTRSFCFVDDLVNGLISTFNSSYEEPINLGNPNEYSIIELVHFISEKFGEDLVIDYKPLPIDDPKRRKPDIKRAKTILNWEPKIELSEGIESTISWFESALSKKNGKE